MVVGCFGDERRMKPFSKLAHMRIPHPNNDELGGAYVLDSPVNGEFIRIIASIGEGWDHVSVSLVNRCPTWEEMEHVKRTFFRDNETAFQLHVPPSDHINNHPYVLHLWRPQRSKIPMPPKEFV